MLLSIIVSSSSHPKAGKSTILVKNNPLPVLVAELKLGGMYRSHVVNGVLEFRNNFIRCLHVLTPSHGSRFFPWI